MSYDSVDYNSIFFLGLLLFLITLTPEHRQPAHRAPVPRGVRMKAMLRARLTTPSTCHGRRQAGLVWRWSFLVSTIVGVIALAALLLNIINGAFGYVALEARVDPATLAQSGVALEAQSKDQLVAVAASQPLGGGIQQAQLGSAF